MSILRHRFIVLSVFLCAAATGVAAQKQLKYGVKTQLADKADLQVAKRGVIAVFDGAATARGVSSGEDYAIWITAVDRFVTGDLIRVVVRVDVTPPSLFRKGNVLFSLSPSFTYDKRRLVEYANANVSKDDTNIGIADYTSVAEHISTLLIQGSERSTTVSLSGVLVASAVVGIADVLKKDPSPVEVAESLYVGQVVLNAVERAVGAGRS